MFLAKAGATAVDAKSLRLWHSRFMSKEAPEEYSDSEATKRMEDALRRALNTPHKPNEKFVGKTLKPKKRKARTASAPKAPKSSGASRARS
jgi:hypothetical protein